MSKVWFVTGCSSGLGRALCTHLLEHGERVVATARREQDVADLAGERCLTAVLDVTRAEDCDRAVAAAVERFGQIDVLVNNAGYGEMGAIEDVSDERARAQFDVNVFGVLNVQRAALPVMRARGRGHVLNVSSIVGLTSFPMAGLYCATKHAVEALSVALAGELEPFGIAVTLIEPGRFRTDFAGRSLGISETPGEAWREATADYDERRRELDGSQPGDPAKAAAAMVAVVESEDPPTRLLLGPDAWEMAHEQLERLQADFDAWKDVTLGTDFDA